MAFVFGLPRPRGATPKTDPDLPETIEGAGTPGDTITETVTTETSITAKGIKDLPGTMIGDVAAEVLPPMAETITVGAAAGSSWRKIYGIDS